MNIGVIGFTYLFIYLTDDFSHLCILPRFIYIINYLFNADYSINAIHTEFYSVSPFLSD